MPHSSLYVASGFGLGEDILTPSEFVRAFRQYVVVRGFTTVLNVGAKVKKASDKGRSAASSVSNALGPMQMPSGSVGVFLCAPAREKKTTGFKANFNL